MDGKPEGRPEGRLILLLRALAEAPVQFILVGGLSGVINGAPIHTEDVDAVHSRDPENIARLLTVLHSLDAIYRMQPERKLRPTASHLAADGQQNLVTRYGWLDLLGTVGRVRKLAYADLLSRSRRVEVGDGLNIQVLDLDLYIALKEELGGDKDRAVLPVLRQTLRERQKAGLA